VISPCLNRLFKIMNNYNENKIKVLGRVSLQGVK
jgi:hypothetical protein